MERTKYKVICLKYIVKHMVSIFHSLVFSPFSNYPEKKNLKKAPSLIRTGDLSITSPASYHWTVAQVVKSSNIVLYPCELL